MSDPAPSRDFGWRWVALGLCLILVALLANPRIRQALFDPEGPTDVVTEQQPDPGLATNEGPSTVPASNGSDMPAPIDPPPASSDAITPMALPVETPHTPQRRYFRTSYDCGIATSAAAIAICSDAGLASLDIRIDRLYADVRRALATQPLIWRQVRQEQRQWVDRREGCMGPDQKTAISCLDSMYRQRISELESYYPAK